MIQLFKTVQFKNFDLLKQELTGIETNGIIGTLYKDLVVVNYKGQTFKQFDDKFGFVHGDFETSTHNFKGLFYANSVIKFSIEGNTLVLNCFALTIGHDIVVVFEDDEENYYYFYYTDIEETLSNQYNLMK